MGRILIADDEEDVAIIVQERLESAGHQVDWAADGGTAWKMFEKNNYDLVILDIQMPVLDGYAVCKMIRNSPKKHIPVMLLSAYIEEKDTRAKTGADAYLSKPFHGGSFADAVQRLLRKGASNHGNQNLPDPPAN